MFVQRWVVTEARQACLYHPLTVPPEASPVVPLPRGKFSLLHACVRPEINVVANDRVPERAAAVRMQDSADVLFGFPTLWVLSDASDRSSLQSIQTELFLPRVLWIEVFFGRTHGVTSRSSQSRYYLRCVLSSRFNDTKRHVLSSLKRYVSSRLARFPECSPICSQPSSGCADNPPRVKHHRVVMWVRIRRPCSWHSTS